MDSLTLIEEDPSSLTSIDYSTVSSKSCKNECNSKSKKSQQQGLTLGFTNLSYFVNHGFKRRKKIILKGIDGEFQAGEITAVMGPSGAGKSSLMNALAGFTKKGLSGSVTVNGREREIRSFSRKSCYILQDDILPNYLTVYESMTIASILKFGEHLDVIEQVLTDLGLDERKNVMVRSLSGGQKKRLAIALELINDPPVMFFDEPTSGLDSSTSKQCIQLLKKLAQEGRTIICTIHQPSAAVFELFDHIYVVGDGHCMYSGSTLRLVPFLKEHGLVCPQYHNPVDFLLDECKDYIQELSLAIKKERALGLKRKTNESLYIRKNAFSSEKSTFWTQFFTLFLRNFKQICRQHHYLQMRLFIHVIVGLLIGCLFYGIGNDGAYIIDNFNLLFFSIMFNMFTAYSSAVVYFPQQLQILMREHFNNWYSLKSFYLAANLSEAPVQIICSLLYFTIVYFMTSQPREWNRYLYTTCTILIVAFVAQSFGYLIGSSMPVANASIFGPLITSPFILFSGFFVLVKDAPVTLQWLFSLSYFKYALHALTIVIFGFNRAKLDCSVDFCRIRAPEKFLRDIGMADGHFLLDWAFLFGTVVLLRISAFYALSIKIKFSK